MKKEYALDIFKLLGQLDSRDRAIWPKLSEAERDGVAPLVIMRWLSGTGDADQIMMLNELVNPVVFALADHKELQLQLLATANNGRRKRYHWQASMKSARKNKLVIKALVEYFDCSEREAALQLALVTTSPELIIAWAETLGWQADELTALKKELK